MKLSQIVPLELYVLIGAFAEEVVSPIPSAIILITAGGIMNFQASNLSYIFFVSLLATVAKTSGAIILYLLANKFEELFLNKFGNFFGVNRAIIENLGAKLKGNWWDYLLLIFMYFSPIFPSGPISLMAGFFKVPIKVFVLSYMAGTYLKSLLYLYIGFTGADFYEKWSAGLATAESYIQFGMIALVVGVILWWKIKGKVIGNK